MANPQPKRNPALRLLGLPALPSKLPSRNWLIFWGVTTSLAAAIIYDGREKRRATARWVAAVAPLAKEPIGNPSAMPRRITVYLEAPPGDGLRVAQDHFAEYIKPVLASSGLDWDFVVGRRQGDVRAAVAEHIRRARRSVKRDLDQPVEGEDAPTQDDAIAEIRRRNGIVDYEGVKGDVIVGRHTWKEYVRGLHEGWLGPLVAPPAPDLGASAAAEPDKSTKSTSEENTATPPADEKPKQPPQPPPYNTTDQYPSSPLPRFIPAELGPSVPISFPHLLGFSSTPTRLRRFLNRRSLADEVGREVAAVCFANSREYREGADGAEQESVLAHEEKDWVKTVWQDEPKKASEDADAQAAQAAPKERIWASPVVLDSRIAARMRRFSLTPEEELRARQIVVPEEQVEGWTKGKMRQLGRWAVRKWNGDHKTVNVGNLDD